jgi:hypothetical protein
MRTLLGGERASIGAASVQHYLKVEVTDADGTWQDLTTLGGVDWVSGADWGEDRDNPVSGASVLLRRSVTPGTVSLAPLVQASTLNRNAAAAYAPLLDIGRLLRISTATKSDGTAPISTDFRPMWQGRQDRIAWQSDPVQVDCSDDGAWMMDTQIETRRTYSNAVGTAVETVMQSILTDNPDGGPAVTLYTPTSPAWNILQYTQERVKKLEALRALASQIGYDLRFRYDAAHAFRLTFLDPLRGRITVDDTIGPTEYLDVTRIELNLDEVRNVGVAPYRDASGVRQIVTQQDAGSISKHRRRYFELDESINIRDAVNAQKLIDAAVIDVSTPGVEQEVLTLYYWPVQLFDRYTFTQNGDHYDTDQTLAVAGYRHSFRNGYGQTTLRCNGKVVGSYAAYAKRFVAPNNAVPVIVGIDVSFPDDTHTELVAHGDVNTASWKIVLRTDRAPTVAEIRAGTPVDGQTIDSLIGTTIPVGTKVWVGAYAYAAGSGLGNESLQYATVVVRGGSNKATPPTPALTQIVTDPGELLATVHAACVIGNTPAASLTYTVTRKVGAAPASTLQSGTGADFPFDLSVIRHPRLSTLVTLSVVDAVTGTFIDTLTLSADGKAGAVGAGSALGLDLGNEGRGGDGGTPVPAGRIHATGLYDATGATPLIDPVTRKIGSGLLYGTGVGVDGLQPAEAGANITENRTSNNTSNVDSVTATVARRGAVKGDTAIDAGNVVVAAGLDLARGYTNKHLGNIPDDATSDRRAATANEKTGGSRGFTALDGSAKLATGVTAGATAADGEIGIESARGSARRAGRGAGTGVVRSAEDNSRGGAIVGVPTPGGQVQAAPLMDSTGAVPLVDPVTRQIMPDLFVGTGVRGADDVQFGAVVGRRYIPSRHNELISAKDGVAKTFSVIYERAPIFAVIPQVWTLPGANSTVNRDIQLKALLTAGQSASAGFTAQAQYVTGGTTVSHTDLFSTTQNTTPGAGGIQLRIPSAVAYCDLASANATATAYTVTYDVDTTLMDPTNTVYVSVYVNNTSTSTTWTLVASNSYGSGLSLTGEAIAFTATLGLDFDVRIVITYTNIPSTGTRAAITAQNVQYNTVTAGTTAQLTPNGDSSILFLASEKS